MYTLEVCVDLRVPTLHFPKKHCPPQVGEICVNPPKSLPAAGGRVLRALLPTVSPPLRIYRYLPQIPYLRMPQGIMKCRVTLLTVWFVCFTFLLHAGSKSDSLQLLLKGKLADTVRIDVLNKLSFELKNSDPSKAIDYALQAVELSEKVKRPKDIARSQHTTGTIYYIQANYPEALKHYLESLKYREQMNDSVNLAKVYNNIALVYYALDNANEALQYHFRSIAIKQKRNDLNGLAYSFGNVGNIYYDLAQRAGTKDKPNEADSLFNVALKYQKNAEEIQQRLVNDNPGNEVYEVGLAGTYNNLGNISLELAVLDHNNGLMFAEALAYHKKAIGIQEKYNDLIGKSHSHINIAGVYEKQGQFDKAILEYTIAMSIAQSLELPDEKRVIYEGLSLAYENKGDFKKRLEYFKLFSEIKDSIFSDLKSEQIAEMQEKYNAEKNEKGIIVLSKNQKIAAAELEKEKVLKRSFTWGFGLAIVIVLLTVAFLFILWNRYKLKTRISAKLEEQNVLIGMKNKEITDSIRYAKRIQESILPPDAHVKQLLPDSFILYKPKDIVSGDFYWAEEWGGKVLVAVADCTGHGVPGAFMSIVGHNLLDQAVTVYGLDKPALILNFINKQLYKMLHQNSEEQLVKDGMDICVIALDRKTMKLEFAGAFNSLWIIRDKEFIELQADRMPVGAFLGEVTQQFTAREFDLKSGDQLYLHSDGFADQFGGPHGKKFKGKQLKQLLTDSSSLSMSEQRETLVTAFEMWKGDLEQIDDVCLIGIRI